MALRENRTSLTGWAARLGSAMEDLKKAIAGLREALERLLNPEPKPVPVPVPVPSRRRR